jgi:hypothetical protein
MCVYDRVCWWKVEREVRVETNAMDVEERYLRSTGMEGKLG